MDSTTTKKPLTINEGSVREVSIETAEDLSWDRESPPGDAPEPASHPQS